MHELIITDSYRKKADKFFKKHPDLLSRYGKVMKLLCLNPKHPSLRLHALKGRLEGLSSVSINLSYRVLVHFILQDGKIMPVDIGSHGEVY